MVLRPEGMVVVIAALVFYASVRFGFTRLVMPHVSLTYMDCLFARNQENLIQRCGVLLSLLGTGADSGYLLTGFISERGERKRVVSSEARKYSWGVWGGAVSPSIYIVSHPPKNNVIDSRKKFTF